MCVCVCVRACVCVCESTAAVRKEVSDETDRVTGKSKQISPIPIHLSIYSPNGECQSPSEPRQFEIMISRGLWLIRVVDRNLARAVSVLFGMAGPTRS